MDVCWFDGWACGDEVVGEPAISGIPIYIVGDEVDGFLRNDVMWEQAMGILLELVGEARMLGSMMFGCMFLDCCCAGKPRPTGVMLIASLSGAVSVSSSFMWECDLGSLFNLGGVVFITGSTMLV